MNRPSGPQSGAETPCAAVPASSPPTPPPPAVELSLRGATAADLDAIWAIESAVFGSDAWSREMMREELAADHRHYVVLVDGDDAVRGYAGLLMVGAEGDVQTIAVAPEARGGGHGRRLMEALLDEAERAGVREVFLEVRADNPVAQGLYRSLAFEQLGVRPRYYQPDGVDAVIMKLEMRSRP
ncbi:MULTISPECIES: ribosomal protein S18-alanine N-acetyltransferase [Leucobacter]|uniref:ribosomal protein S18-alanine N-acetyltransferase n=1 Tax=Leucobacter TaxID=55968 RepID=UPI00037C5F17|nr:MULTISPECIES: ribosomal protein S18-alanine N-acetyltransferase [Leucobacter]